LRQITEVACTVSRPLEGGNLLYLNESTLMAQPFDLRRLELTGEPVIVEEGVETNLGWNLGVFSASQNGVLAFAPAAPNSSNQIMWINPPVLHLAFLLTDDRPFLSLASADSTVCSHAHPPLCGSRCDVGN
jgi:hypothetical protein